MVLRSENCRVEMVKSDVTMRHLRRRDASTTEFRFRSPQSLPLSHVNVNVNENNATQLATLSLLPPCSLKSSTSTPAMSIADNMRNNAHERSPKRRRIESDSPDPLSQDHHQAYTSAPKPSHNGIAYNTDGDTDADNQYAYEDESDGAEMSHLHSPAAQEGTSTPTPPTRPVSLRYAPHMTLRGHKRGVAAAKFSPNGKYIASCCKTQQLRT